MRATPRYLLVNVVGSTPANLYDLLHALDADTEDHCQQLELQEAISGGIAKVYIGNSDLDIATSVYGAVLQAGVPQILPSLSSNLILLRQVYLATDGSNVKVGVSITTR